MGCSGKPLNEMERRAILKRLAQGKSVYSTARELRVSEPTVRKIRKEALTSFGNERQ